MWLIIDANSTGFEPLILAREYCTDYYKTYILI